MTIYTCPRCQNTLTAGATACPACGLTFAFPIPPDQATPADQATPPEQATPPAQPAPTWQGGGSETRPPLLRWWAGLSTLAKVGVVVAVIVGIGLVGAVGATRDEAATPSPSSVAVVTSSPTPQATASPSVPSEPTLPASPTPTPTPTPVPTPTPTPRTYKTLTSREWALLVKSPDDHAGEGYKVFGCITQFDAATGNDSFRAQASYRIESYWYSDGENALFSGDADLLATFVEDDVVAMDVISLGSFTYGTQIGGETTAPLFLVSAIKLSGSCA